MEQIRKAAKHFRLRDDSPLIDAGRYNPHLGTDDFLGTHIYYGDAPDIGIAESRIGERVDNPVDDDPIEEEGPTGPTSRSTSRSPRVRPTPAQAGPSARRS